MEILKRDLLPLGGFAGLKEHQLVKDPAVFGPTANEDSSWPGIGNFVYLADARFLPHGETRLHKHREVDVISVLVDGRISHEGSLQHGRNLTRDDVQVQRAGGEGFSHNEINPDDDMNRMLQLWVLPETAGQAADYRVYQPETGELTCIYGGDSHQRADFPSNTLIDVALLKTDQQITVAGPFMAYLSRGEGTANNQHIQDGDLIRGDSLNFQASNDVQLIVVHLNQ
jgi:redox-sensitive bicupin YhaK (pirin superfamily)